MDHGLNERQRRFADGVLEGMSLKAAYEQAGYKSRGSAARKNASRLMTNDDVRAYLAEQRKKLTERVLMSAEKVVELFTRQATWLPAEIVTHEITCPRDIAKLPEATQLLIEGWHYDSKNRFVLEFVDRQHALDQLGKIFGVFQADRMNDRDREADLLATVFWRFVMAHHLHHGTPIADVIGHARRNPKEVEEWAESVGLIGSGEDAA